MRSAVHTDRGGPCAFQVGPACLEVGWGQGPPHEHRSAPGMTLRQEKDITVRVEGTFRQVNDNMTPY